MGVQTHILKTSQIPDIRFYRYFLRSGPWAWWAKLAYQVMLTIRGRLITPFVLGSMSVGLNILIRHSFMDLWFWITALVSWPQLILKSVNSGGQILKSNRASIPCPDLKPAVGISIKWDFKCHMLVLTSSSCKRHDCREDYKRERNLCTIVMRLATSGVLQQTKMAAKCCRLTCDSHLNLSFFKSKQDNDVDCLQ